MFLHNQALMEGKVSILCFTLLNFHKVSFKPSVSIFRREAQPSSTVELSFLGSYVHILNT